MLAEFNCMVWYSHKSFEFGDDHLYSFMKIFLYHKKRQPYNKAALLAHKFFQCKRVLYSCGFTTLRCGVLLAVLKRSSYVWRLILACCAAWAPLLIISRGEVACDCTGVEVALSLFSQGWGGTGSFRVDTAEQMQAPT